MDTKALKLEVLERIALIDDEDRLLEVKRLLDGPRGYGVPNTRLNVVQEELARFLPAGRAHFTAEEVQAIIAQVRAQLGGA
jgi:hypothetical protein